MLLEKAIATTSTNTSENNNKKVWLLYAGLKIKENANLDKKLTSLQN
jgi:hypothetical protein